MARLLYRLGTFSARHKLTFIIGWIALIVVIAIAALSGMKFATGGFTVPGTESSKALQVLDEKFPSASSKSSTLQLVFEAKDGAKITSASMEVEVQKVLADAKTLDHVSSLTNPLDAARPYISADGTTALSTVSLRGVTDDNQQEVYTKLVTFSEHASTGDVRVLTGGSLGTAVPEIFGPSEVIGALIAFTVLLVTFGSLIAAGANMFGALIGVGVGVLGVLAVSAAHPIQSTTPILAVMLGLAVGIDYGLFILSRYRQELRDGRGIEVAIGRAIGTAGSSVVFAGATVVIALVGLAVVNIPFITEMGLAGGFAVLVAVAMALTLMPAMMALMGHRVLPRKERHARRATNTQPIVRPEHRVSFLERWAAFVVRRPVISAVTAGVVLMVVAIPLLSMKTTLNVPGGEDPKAMQRTAYNLVSDKFGAGSQDPLIVLVEGQDVAAANARVEATLSGLSDVARVTPAGTSKTGDAAIYSLTPKSGPLDTKTQQLVRDIRSHDADVTGVTLSVTGATAVNLDTNAQLSSALVKYIALIVGLSLILLIIMFRSILVPLTATAGFLLSLGAAMGVSVAVFQWGWFNFAISSPQGNPLLSLLPIILTGILFGLAMDYQVFLVSRMHEAYSKGLPAKEAILDGFGRSSVVVVAAASIMAAVFGGFALSASSFVASIGLALAAGVIADAFITRMIIIPALLSLFGRGAWWIPKWLDRILPHLDTEGHALEQDDHEEDERVRDLASASS
ncbi:Membrane protein YdfJ [Frondihabitans sp. 762G35]|uniref:MMPL family transporter n=1 Tax=Frondihabitans sp. 762G35 TaxID=1446794 RepID=UPI000D20FF2B|nr:MMPL family transporter [Frondihabitans sp. 762G35]ARC58636.1 Membrane protein YdfJ [Frondihabitans sp. 762G35]